MTIMSVLEKNWVRGGLVRALGMAISMVTHSKGLRYKGTVKLPVKPFASQYNSNLAAWKSERKH
jgi:hypothetical protein